MRKKTPAHLVKELSTAKQKQYVVLCEGDLWVVGTRQDIMNDFNGDPDAYMSENNDVKIYELGEQVPFTFVEPKLTF
jgi:hypothetical protein